MADKIIITNAAHSRGFQTFDFHTTSGVLDIGINPITLVHIRNLLDSTLYVSHLEAIVDNIDRFILEKEPDIGYRAKMALKDAANGYYEKVCEFMGIGAALVK